MPLAEFDALLTGAAAATHRESPRLIDSRFRAALVGEALAGKAEWNIVHHHAAPGLMSVDPMNLAITRAMWDDGSPAVLGDLDSRPQAPGLELLVGRPGVQKMSVDWTARGVPEPGGLRFDLQVPACPVAVLELDLPADREPTVSRDDGLLTGPLPGPSADRRLWRLAFANASQIDLIVRPAADHGPPPPLLVTQRTRLDITPEETTCEFAFDLDAANGADRDLVVRLDHDVRPTDVSARNLEQWSTHLAAEAGGPTAINIRLREPLQTGSLTICAVVPTAASGRWTCPTATVSGAIPRGEVLSIRIHPDLMLEDWRAGEFRLTESIVSPDRWHVLTLHPALSRDYRQTVRELETGLRDYRVREKLTWEVTPDRMTVTAKLAFDIARGSVEDIALQLPANWAVRHIEADLPDLLADEQMVPIDQKLRVKLKRPIGRGKPVELTISMYRSTPEHRGELTILCPDVVATEARGRDGTLAILVPSAMHPSMRGWRNCRVRETTLLKIVCRPRLRRRAARHL